MWLGISLRLSSALVWSFTMLSLTPKSLHARPHVRYIMGQSLLGAGDKRLYQSSWSEFYHECSGYIISTIIFELLQSRCYIIPSQKEFWFRQLIIFTASQGGGPFEHHYWFRCLGMHISSLVWLHNISLKPNENQGSVLVELRCRRRNYPLVNAGY